MARCRNCRRRHGGRGEGEDASPDRWLVTYADMITLLMALFIVMFSMSQVDGEKYDALKSSLAQGFGQSAVILNASPSVLSDSAMTPMSAVAPDLLPGNPSERAPAAVSEAILRHDASKEERRYAEAEAEVIRLNDVLRRLYAALRARGLEHDVEARIDERGLVVSLVSRHVVFEPNLATLAPRGRKVLVTLAPVLSDMKDNLEIAGHTNQVDVKPKYFATDWDLSAARAVTVLRYLNEAGKIASKRMYASAYGQEKPLVDPARAGSQNVNKRVDIVILSPLSADARELLAVVATATRTGNGEKR